MTDIDVSALVSRPESQSGLVRFEDQTDLHAPRLNYSVPLPSSYAGKAFLELDLGKIAWAEVANHSAPSTSGIAASRKDTPRTLIPPAAHSQPSTDSSGTTRRRTDLNHIGAYAGTLEANGVTIGFVTDEQLVTGQFPIPQPPPPANAVLTVVVENLIIPVEEIKAAVASGKRIQFSRGFGGELRYTYVKFVTDEAQANPRFVIVEHYRLTSHFGDYGAGRTINTFSLWPGEETRLYVRSWRRTEQKLKEASSIFDSFTNEAATDFENSFEQESSTKSTSEESGNWNASAGLGLDLGVFQVGASGGGGGSSKSSREELAKTVSKVSRHHASKASAARETTVSTEIEATEAAEFEQITERNVKNTNLSRVLNLVCRELNQELISYFSLIDVSIAFANDRGVFDRVPLYRLDKLIEQYVAPGSIRVRNNRRQGQRERVKDAIMDQIRNVHDYQDKSHSFLEKTTDIDNKSYWRVRRPSPDGVNPFHPELPVEGIVIDATKHTVRTDAVIIDALLGHGVALDNYALGQQQEALRQKQLENRKLELGLAIVESGDKKKLDAFEQLFVDRSCEGSTEDHA